MADELGLPLMKQEGHPEHNMPLSEYHAYMHSMPTGTSGDRAADSVTREKKSSSEKKDQSRFKSGYGVGDNDE